MIFRTFFFLFSPFSHFLPSLFLSNSLSSFFHFFFLLFSQEKENRIHSYSCNLNQIQSKEERIVTITSWSSQLECSIISNLRRNTLLFLSFFSLSFSLFISLSFSILISLFSLSFFLIPRKREERERGKKLDLWNGSSFCSSSSSKRIFPSFSSSTWFMRNFVIVRKKLLERKFWG